MLRPTESPNTASLQWFRDADFASTDLDADGKFVLLSCQLETQNWDEAYSLAIALKQEDFVEAPALLHFAGMARLLTVLPEEFRDAFRTNQNIKNGVCFGATGSPRLIINA